MLIAGLIYKLLLGYNLKWAFNDIYALIQKKNQQFNCCIADIIIFHKYSKYVKNAVKAVDACNSCNSRRLKMASADKKKI